MYTPKIAFFGGEPLGVPTLEVLKRAHITPALIVCNPDRPAGRGQKMTSPPVKVWAQDNTCEVFQPTSYKKSELLHRLTDEPWDLFVVVAYNFILPKWLLDIPKYGVLNVHPSLLPALRGASPIRTAILDNYLDAVGVTVMLMDEEMDHGPILEQATIDINEHDWPLPGPVLDQLLATAGGELLAEVIPTWLAGELLPQEQEHGLASYTKRFTKEDARVDIDPHNLPVGEAAYRLLCKIRAFTGIGDVYFEHQGTRVKVKDAELATDGTLRLLRVVPAGKVEMDFTRYLQSLQ